MDSDWRKRIQITFIIFIVIAGIRVGVIFYDRTHWTEPEKPQPESSFSYKVTEDDYVTPHKLFPYDLASARELAGKTAWVRTGNQLRYYHSSSTSHRLDSVAAGYLGPLEKLEIKDVIAQSLHGQKQIMAVFTRAGAPDEGAVSVGTITNGTYTFTINDIFFIDDPHKLYNHWPADVWNAIDQHQVKSGMNELQASFALGTNIRANRGDYGNRDVQYINSNTGKSVTVTFSGNKAVSVEAEKD
jgi:hypothetical protein